MPAQMTHGERVAAALQGKPVDRLPVSMWRHFFAEEQIAGGLVEAMLAYQRQYDWDFVKLNPRAQYHVEDWGARFRYGTDLTRQPERVSYPVQQPKDWERVQPLDIHKGVLGQHLEALRAVVAGVKGEAPVLMTVFTPLAIAAALTKDHETMLGHLREHWDAVAPAMEAVTDTFSRYARACLDAGASGLFFATTTWGTYDRLTDVEYQRWARPYDLRVLQAVAGASFNLLHVCRDRNMLAALKDYPVHAFNWDAYGQGNPSLKQGRGLTGKCVVGGIPHRDALVNAVPQQLALRVPALRREMGSAGWMLGTGCTYVPTAPEANVWAVRDAVG
ncbi:MAG: uroporphyrinogen decarboxylase [Chloroflexi bacterium]|nr:uroporphyrinogen decarboxylase [Chloroflexota bacterium]